mgnify:CR=1 FL=1
MIAHLIPDEKFTNKIINFFTNEFEDIENNFIVYYDGHVFYGGNFNNVNYVNNLCKEEDDIINILKKSDKIVVHGFDSIDLILFLNKHIALTKKCIFLIWGADIYNDHLFLKSHQGLFIKRRIKTHMKKRMLRRSRNFMTFTYDDFNKAHDWFGIKGNRYDCLYPSNLNISGLKQIEKNLYKQKNPDIVRIIVGNSATETNNHFEAFAKLSKFKDKNINVYCPLSYGDMNYAIEVEKEGKKIFKEKFIPIKNFMNIDEYSKLLASMDIGIFAYNRQQATENLEILSYFGAKMYLKKGTALWTHYVERDSCKFYNFLDIDSLSFDEFCIFDENSKVYNHEYFSNIWDINYICSLWKKVFNSTL